MPSHSFVSDRDNAGPRRDPANVRKGRWFYCDGWIVFPKTEASVAWLREKRRLSADTEKACRQLESKARSLLAKAGTSGRPPGQVAEFHERAIDLLLQATVKSETTKYNTQLDWSLGDPDATSPAKATEIAQEFVSFARLASEEFGWGSHILTRDMDLPTHSWKHVAFEHMQSALEFYPPGVFSPPGARLRLLGADDVGKRLLGMAAKGDPRAVARLNHLFRSKSNMLDGARLLLGKDAAREVVNDIPSPGSLAAAYTGAVFRDPDSEEAENARRSLMLLVSKAALKGATPGGGRPQIPHDEESVELAYTMGYGLSVQLRRVDRFLGGFVPSGEERISRLAELYPSLCQWLRTDIVSFLEFRPTQGACQIASIVLGISPSKVEKTVYKERRST